MAFKSLYAVQLEVKGRAFIAGKVVDYRGQRVFFRTPAKDAVLHKWSALSMDARLIPELESDGVSEIHIMDGGVLYVSALSFFKSQATPGDHGDGSQLYLPLDLWLQRKPYIPTYTVEVRRI